MIEFLLLIVRWLTRFGASHAAAQEAWRCPPFQSPLQAIARLNVGRPRVRGTPPSAGWMNMRPDLSFLSPLQMEYAPARRCSVERHIQQR
jgi:hypothetical protein